MTDIVVRKVSFDFPDHVQDVFPGDDIVAECYLAAFSLTMPALEPYLIRTYRSIVGRITDPVLAKDVQAFIQQEAQHYKNHAKVNKVIHAQLGSEVSARLQAIEDELDAVYHKYNDKKSARFNTVYAEGFEAMTCAMVMTFFRASRDTPGARFGEFQQLFAWHAAEEFEHRTVAFDVYKSLYGGYVYRVLGSLRAQVHFSRYVDRLQRVLLEAHGQPARRHLPTWWKRGWRQYLHTFRRRYDPAGLEQDPLVEVILAQFT